jgi:UDP-N-acetylglucosamine--N-acetylmuramyl-(pentapeptide) pyrophosphoryl-undecaprenol N-acetylglucosamine transferase
VIAMGQLAIACGGTGGHLFPGLAVAEAVRRRGHEVSYFISGKAVDRRALRGAGEELHGVEIPAVGWSGAPMAPTCSFSRRNAQKARVLFE